MSLEILKNNFVFYDGGMGTMLQKNGLKAGEYPDLMNVKMPSVVEKIQTMYADAGCDIICTNTFGANERNMKNTGYGVSEVITAAVKIAKAAGAGRTLTALDMGPVGSFMEPAGNMTFDAAYELFRQQAVVGEAAGADLVAIETMSDLSEMRAAILAVRENTKLPVFATMTFGKNGRTLTGCKPECFAAVAQGLGAEAIGINCSLAPEEIFPIAKRLAAFTTLPLIIKPNAGLPNSKTGAYDIDPVAYAQQMKPYASIGVKIVGGCCGTTPEYIRELISVYSQLKPIAFEKETKQFLCTPSKIIYLDEIDRTIDREKNIDDYITYAMDQAEDGEEVINLYIPDHNSPEEVTRGVRDIQSVATQPMHIISSNPQNIEAALRSITGIAAVSSSKNSEELRLIAKKYGAIMLT